MSAVEGRFWAKVDKNGEGGCWVWTSGTARGYGYFWLNGKMISAHRFAYELLVAPIPAGMQIDHVCHVRRCVSPEHLRVVTRAQNMQHQAATGQARNKSGYRGVGWDRSRQKWRAQVKFNGKNRGFGRFDTAAEAGEAARLARNELFTHNNLDRMETA